jgi:hypothetical protein
MGRIRVVAEATDCVPHMLQVLNAARTAGARRQWPSHCAADQRDELAALQLIDLDRVTARLDTIVHIDFTMSVCCPFCNRVTGWGPQRRP